MRGILSAFLNEPNVHDAMMNRFENQLYLQPYGAEALGHVMLTRDDPHIPESAAMDMTPLGASAISAVASIRNSANEMALANQQAQAIARNTKVAAVRAYEALRSYQVIFLREEAAKQPKGTATAMLAIPVQRRSFLTRALASSFKGKKRGGKGAASIAAGLGSLPGLSSSKADFFDESVGYLRQDLEQAFASLRQVSLDAAVQANAIEKKYLEVQNASRAFAEALILPGLPVPPAIPPVMLQPPRRPRDLSPLWLDVPYAISPGGDPYAVHDGGQRGSMAAKKKGIPGFNPFEGTVPFGQDGFKPFYAKVGHRSPKVNLKAGLDVEAGKGPPEAGNLDMLKAARKDSKVFAKGFFPKAAVA